MQRRSGSYPFWICLLVLAVGCAPRGPHTWRELADGRRAPGEWTLGVTGQRDATHPLRYDVLYVADPAGLNPIYRAKWYRIWPDGQVAAWVNYVSDPPRGTLTAADGDDFRRSLPGRYRVAGTELRMEFAGYAECGPEYIRLRGGVRSDGSFVLRKTELSGRPPDFEVYRPHPVEDMTRSPDW
jgi:hypothetical protein